MSDTPPLFDSLTLKSITLRNRIAVSPMCQYSCEDGFANDWHFTHLGSRAVGGAALVMVEATAVEATGRITPADMGLWKDGHIAPLARIASFIQSQGAVPGIQIAHAGRKASCQKPWEGGKALTAEHGGWQTLAPSALPFNTEDPIPKALAKHEIPALIESFAACARRALKAGFEVLEIHGAHGYLIHEFLSPLSNTRADAYGGSLENRLRFALEVTDAVRNVWPAHLPLFFRVSATDWKEGGWNLDESVELARQLKTKGVDLVDCSSGGAVPDAKIKSGPGYQIPFAERIRKEAGILTGGVGLITQARQANDIIASGKADIVLLARAMLRDPYWPLHAAMELDAAAKGPVQYDRAFDKPKARR